MPNSNYIKGRRKEYKVMEEERKKGNIVLRSAGSHSPVDIVSIDVTARVIKLIQCKSDNFPQIEIDELQYQMRELNNAYRCEFVVV